MRDDMFDRVCKTCGKRWGSHFGDDCPDGEGKFKDRNPKKTRERYQTLQVTADELGRLTCYALAYRGGGFQNLIQDILKRNLENRK